MMNPRNFISIAAGVAGGASAPAIAGLYDEAATQADRFHLKENLECCDDKEIADCRLGAI